MTKITGNDIILNVNYDDYGNVIEYDTSSYTYNSRNLMDSFSGIKDLSGDILYVQCQYKYNYQGVRCEKIKTTTLNGRNPVSTSVKYHLNGSTILEEDWLNSSGNIKEKMEYFYDAEGICGIRYNDHNFTLIKDSLGNVSKVMYQGKVIGEYEYNAWGECTVIEHSIDKDNDAGLRDRFVLHNNPFRYKGYYWDSESNLYYCNYRYYSPELCRFISPDDISYLDPSSVNGLNLYCYCLNNPISYADPSGHFVIMAAMIWTAIGIGAGLGAGIGFGAAYISDVVENVKADGFQLSDLNTFEDNWQHYLGATVGGAISGVGIGLCSVLGAGLGVALATKTSLVIGGSVISGGVAFGIGATGAFVTGGLGYTARTLISDRETFELSDMFIESGINMFSGMLTFAGALAGGVIGIKVPGQGSFKNFILYQLFMSLSSIYFIKYALSQLRKTLQENY